MTVDVDKVERFIKVGWKDRNWYNECQQLFEDLFGKDDLELVCDLFAATSINTSLKSNITLFRRAFYEIKNDLPVGSIRGKKGEPLGYLPNIHTQLTNIREGKGLSGRKIRSYSDCMSGRRTNIIVCDIWLLRTFDQDQKYFRQTKGKEKGRGIYRSAGATDKQYTMIEEWCRDKAERLGIETRQLSAVLWSGARISTNGDTQTHYKELLTNKIINLFGVI
jgi:hypothetical protein